MIRRTLVHPGWVLVPLGLIVATVLILRDPYPLFFPDSPSYINWEVARSAGYPLFLRAVRLVDPQLGAVRWVQPLLFVLMTAALSETIARTLGKPHIGWFVGILTLANLPLLRFSLGIIAESLFATLLMAHLAAVLLLLARPTPPRWLLAGLTAAGTVVVRPAGLSLLAGAVILLLLPRLRRADFLRYFVVPLASVWLLAALLTLGRFGVFALQEFGGISLVGNVAFLIDEGTVSRYPGLGPALARDLEPWRKASEGLGWPREHYWFTTSEWNPMVHQAQRSLGEYAISHPADVAPLARLPPAAMLSRLGQDVGMAAVVRHPAPYLRHVAAHLYGMWTLPQWLSAAEMARMRSAMAPPHVDRVPDEAANMFSFVSQRTALFLALKDLVMGGILLATIGGVAVSLRSRADGATDAAWAFCSVNLHAAFALVAMVQAASWRFSIVWWPYGLLALGLFIDRIATVAMRRRAKRALPRS